MNFSIAVNAIQLESDEDGVIRIGNTRVTLDTIIAAFLNGATAEEITQQYPSLNLADVYQVIGQYLRQPEAIDEYLNQRRSQSEAVRGLNESRFDPQGIRDRLLARRAGQGK